VEAPPQRALGDVEHARDLDAGELLEVAQDEGDLLIARQARQRLGDLREQLAALELDVEQLGRGGDALEELRLMAAPAALGAERVARDVGRDAEDPGLDRRRAAKRGRGAADLEERGLDQVIAREIVGHRQSPGEAIDRGVEAIEQRAERGGIAGAARGDQCLVGHLEDVAMDPPQWNQLARHSAP
jgi:hypothetical protein